jgi:pectinacetylesterase
MTNRSKARVFLRVVAVICFALGCASKKGDDNSNTTQGGGTGGTVSSGSGGSGAVNGMTGTGGHASPGGSTGTSGNSAGMKGGAGSSSPMGGGAGEGTTQGGGGTSGTPGDGGMTTPPVNLAPSVRNPKYKSVAPALGDALPAADPGTWTYTDIDGAVSRDGSPAGFYYKFSKTGDKNLLIYLAGGGACQDTFFCNMNPPNKTMSLTAESITSGILNVAGPSDEAQDPTLERWQSGIFKDDQSNPVKDWNMVFIPYVTGDVFAGAKPNATVPNVDGTFQFVGRTNMLKFLARIVPTFKDAKVVVLTGSSAGGLGALLTAPFIMDAYIDLGTGARGFVVDDAGPFFDDDYLEVCLQKRYRDLFGLNDAFPEDCPDCKGDGGGLTKAYLAYLVDKYPDNLLGGLIDSDADEIMSFFFSEGLENCSYIDNPIVGVAAYPEDRYKMALQNLLDVHMKRMSSYVWSGTLHQNFFMTDSGDRFYDMNGLQETPAQWLSKMLTGEMERVGL